MEFLAYRRSDLHALWRVEMAVVLRVLGAGDPVDGADLFGVRRRAVNSTLPRYLFPPIRWLFPGMPEEIVNLVAIAVRKCAHPAEFGVLALLLWRALVKPARHSRLHWRWADARLSLVLTMLYAATDEFHQTLVLSRSGTVGDFFLDGAGAVAALLVLWAIYRWRSNSA